MKTTCLFLEKTNPLWSGHERRATAAWGYQEVHRVQSHCAACGFSFGGMPGLKLASQPRHGDLKQGRSQRQRGRWRERSHLWEDPGRRHPLPAAPRLHLALGSTVPCSDSSYQGDIVQIAQGSGPHINPPAWPELISTDDTCTLIPLSLL